MKRLMTAVAMSCIAGFALAATNEVTSVNIVGYNKIPAPPGIKIFAPMFYIGSNTVSEVMGTNGTANSSQTLADNVYLYRNASYVTLWLYDASDGPEFDHKWVDGSQVATNIILPGEGFWVRNRAVSTNTYTQIGEAVGEGAVTNTIKPGLQILAYPYSADVAVGSLSCTNGVANSSQTLADNVYVYTPGVGYATYWLYDNSDGPAFDHKWVDGSQVATNIISGGQGFWYRSRSGGNVTWIQNKPY
mgnify:CR=1 FL=1